MDVSSKLHAAVILPPPQPGKEPRYPLNSGQAPELVWVFCGRETSLALVGVRIPDGLARILFTITTEISQFLNTMGQYLKIGRDHFPPHAFRFTSHSLPPTPRHNVTFCIHVK
jgi:hypothetical protein